MIKMSPKMTVWFDKMIRQAETPVAVFNWTARAEPNAICRPNSGFRLEPEGTRKASNNHETNLRQCFEKDFRIVQLADSLMLIPTNLWESP